MHNNIIYIYTCTCIRVLGYTCTCMSRISGNQSVIADMLAQELTIIVEEKGLHIHVHVHVATV